jgi:ubiquitin-activating enzyme E1
MFYLCVLLFFLFFLPLLFFDRYVVTNISNSCPPTVRVLVEPDRPLSRFIDDGSVVELIEVQGMDQINTCSGVARLSRVNKDELVIEGIDATRFGRYLTGGVLKERKQPKNLTFKPFVASRDDPGEFAMEDFCKWGRSQQLHNLFRVLDHYPAVDVDVPSFVEAAKRQFEEVDVELAAKLAALSCGNLSPVCAMLGGLIAQEALKFTGKFTPIQQWAYFDCLDVVPDPLPLDRGIRNDRFDGQRIVFGEAVQQRLAALSLFMIGSGALGCELLKVNFFLCLFFFVICLNCVL